MQPFGFCRWPLHLQNILNILDWTHCQFLVEVNPGIEEIYFSLCRQASPWLHVSEIPFLKNIYLKQNNTCNYNFHSAPLGFIITQSLVCFEPQDIFLENLVPTSLKCNHQVKVPHSQFLWEEPNLEKYQQLTSWSQHMDQLFCSAIHYFPLTHFSI